MSKESKCEKCGGPLSVFEAGLCGKCKSPIQQMHEQIERLCERMNVAEQILTTGYIYPKTLPDDVVIVIRAPMRLMDSEIDYITASIRCVWPNNMVHVLHSGLSLEIIEGAKHESPKEPKEPELDRMPDISLFADFNKTVQNMKAACERSIAQINAFLKRRRESGGKYGQG